MGYSQNSYGYIQKQQALVSIDSFQATDANML